MKKILLGATALTLVAGAASAQEWTARVGGFATLGFGYIDADEELNNTETTVINNAEVIFNFRLVADNGITFGYKVEMEAHNGTVDESVGFAQGSFGRVEIGQEDGAHDILVGGLPGGNFTSAADNGGIIFDLNEVMFIRSQGADTSDDLKITYYTPTFAGFTAGVSYAPNGQDNTTSSGNFADGGEAIELGARYQNTFGDFGVRVAGGYTSFLNDQANFDDSYTISASVDFAGFSFGGIYGDSNGNDDVGGVDVAGWGVGADYTTGPWYFGIQYGTNSDGPESAANGRTITSIEDNQGISAEVNYALAPGVTAAGVVEFGEFDETAPGVDDSAFAVGAFLGLNF